MVNALDMCPRTAALKWNCVKYDGKSWSLEGSGGTNASTRLGTPACKIRLAEGNRPAA
jgi:hypothetical protein